MKIYFEISGTKVLRRKMAAATELFASPVIRLTGTWKDEEGDFVFFDYRDSSPISIDAIEGKFVNVLVDGETLTIAPTDHSGMRVYIE